MAATGELTISLSPDPSDQEVPDKVLLLTEEVGAAEEIEEGTEACWGPRGKRETLSLGELIQSLSNLRKGSC